MRKKLLNRNEYERACENCFYGRMSAEKDCVFCSKSGIMQRDYACAKYKYDPLKRTPKRNKKLPEYSEEDFKL